MKGRYCIEKRGAPYATGEGHRTYSSNNPIAAARHWISIGAAERRESVFFDDQTQEGLIVESSTDYIRIGYASGGVIAEWVKPK